MGLAEIILAAAEIYLALGIAVALGFVLAGLRRFGPVTPGARLLIAPAAALLWPLILRRWQA